MQDIDWAGTVYHGMPEETLRPNFSRGQYLAFLGRITPEKGPHIAIRWARQAGIPIKIAAKIPRAETRFFHEHIEPHLDGKNVAFIGEVNDQAKEDFLGNAIALLFPIDWPEPFGLVMIEAMACGTPTIAMRRSSVPEIIEDGLTGFVIDNEEDGMRALSRISELNRRAIHKEFLRRFTAKRMALDYVRHFRAVTSAGTRPEVNGQEIAVIP
jgi:glycosyltransferase involved in cell wall biosynthesis